MRLSLKRLESRMQQEARRRPDEDDETFRLKVEHTKSLAHFLYTYKIINVYGFQIKTDICNGGVKTMYSTYLTAQEASKGVNLPSTVL